MQGQPPNPENPVPAKPPEPPVALTIPANSHAHIPGPRAHDDHPCTCVRCTECGVIGRAVNGAWQDVT